MKKLLALLLSVIMAASLAVPAFADGPDGPPAAADLGIIGGQDGPVAVISTGGLDGILNGGFSRPAADDELKAALGGVPGQIGVMVNGAYVKFPDAAPEISGGRTMIPFRALMETLGGEVEFADGKVVCKTDEIRLTFTPGSNEVLVEYPGGELPGDGQIFPLDCAPYIKGGRTYVPIRFFSEAMGYEVGWDSALRTVILVDKAAMAEEIDKNFTILNKVQAGRSLALGEGEMSLTDTRCSLKAIVFDTLNGDQTYTADLTGKTIMNAKAVNGAYSIDISDDAVDLLMGMLIGGEGPEYEADAAVLRTVITGLKDTEVIMNAEGGAWVHTPVFDEMAGKKNVWYSMDLGAELGALLALQTNAANLTIGSVAAGMVDVNSVAACSSVDEMVRMLAAIYGDEKFTTANGVSALSFTLDDLAALAPDSEQDVKDAFKTYKITMKVDEKGGASVSCVMETAAQTGVPGIKITINAKQSAGKANMTMKIHVANICEAELRVTSSEAVREDSPETNPPKDAVIIDADTPAVLPELGGSGAAR